MVHARPVAFRRLEVERMTVWRCKVCGRASKEDAPEGWEIGYDLNFHGTMTNIRIICDQCLRAYPSELNPFSNSKTITWSGKE